jgi:hypothetical protein
MLKKIYQFALVLPVVAMLAGCAMTFPGGATSNPVGSKVGKAAGHIYLGCLFFDQDASIMTAAKNGGITKISTFDVRTTSILGIVQGYETIVTGE